MVFLTKFFGPQWQGSQYHLAVACGLIRYHALKSFSDPRYSALTDTLPRGGTDYFATEVSDAEWFASPYWIAGGMGLARGLGFWTSLRWAGREFCATALSHYVRKF